MVRNIVGTIFEVGKGKLAQSDVGVILAAKDRSAAGPTAPANGLFLKEIFYSS
jgi:tRNA pseudouridine38-40 synthase